MTEVNEMYAFVSDDGTGKEGVMAFSTPSGLMIPLVGTTEDKMREYLPKADELCKQYNITYKIVKFSNREDITGKLKIHKP